MRVVSELIGRIRRRVFSNGRATGHRLVNLQPGAETVELVTVEQANDSWARTKRGSRLSFVRLPVLRRDHKVFTMGSCFAREFRLALAVRGLDILPRYEKIPFDPRTQLPHTLPQRPHLNHYTTFSIRYEFERAFAGEHYAPGDFLRVPNKRFASATGSHMWQDPNRRNVFGADLSSIMDLSRKIDDCISEGLMAADHYVITLGLTEVWRNKANGYYLNQAPDPRADVHCEFERSTYEQNLDNMRAVCSLLAANFPERKIFLTVSPVPLKRTFSGLDVAVANAESKSILRAVAAAISCEFSNVIYWPSFEIANAADFYEADGRNITSAGFTSIVDQFLATHAVDVELTSTAMSPSAEAAPSAIGTSGPSWIDQRGAG